VLDFGRAKRNFSGSEDERARGFLMNYRSPVVLFVVVLALAMLAGGIAIFAPAFLKVALLFLSVIPILITVVGVLDCISSGKSSNTILLWIIIMILAPLLGPLLWFAWGRRNT
jgi:hypothetical protein